MSDDRVGSDVMPRRSFLMRVGAGAAGLALSRLPLFGQAEDQPLYSFIALADPHLREDRQGEPAGVDKFRRALDAIAKLEHQPDLMLMLGDIHPEKLEALLPEVPLPILPIAGNHESTTHRTQLRAMFPELFGERDYYCFEHRGDLFLGICTAIPGDHIGHLQSQFIAGGVNQCAWLVEQLGRSGEFGRVFMFGHVPPEAQNRASTMCLGQNDSRWLQERVIEHRPAALFFGHRHYRVWFDLDGVPVYGCRSCNWNSKGEPVGFLQVKVFPDRHEVEFIDTSPEA